MSLNLQGYNISNSDYQNETYPRTDYDDDYELNFDELDDLEPFEHVRPTSYYSNELPAFEENCEHKKRETYGDLESMKGFHPYDEAENGIPIPSIEERLPPTIATTAGSLRDEYLLPDEDDLNSEPTRSSFFFGSNVPLGSYAPTREAASEFETKPTFVFLPPPSDQTPSTPSTLNVTKPLPQATHRSSGSDGTTVKKMRGLPNVINTTPIPVGGTTNPFKRAVS